MSTSPQPRVLASGADLSANPEILTAASTPQPDSGDPLQLLRDAINRLKSHNGELPDQAQVANLLAEAREALERASVVARVVAECEGFLKESHFDQAIEALDAGLLIYPTDPALVARRRDVELRKKAFESAAAARAAIEEANWLADQDRIDMAVHFLKDKAAAIQAQPALISRLEELETLLPRWEEKRQVQAALGRARMLEESQQWRAALTILEETSRLYPASGELAEAEKRLRNRLLAHEREKKLARRLELIGQKIVAQSWSQAFTLLEDARKEFPDTPELNALERQADAGRRRSEREAVAGEVRQCVADGELEQAEQVLRRGLEALGPEPALEALRAELESQRKYREELGRAQVLFAQRQLLEAERVLAQMVAVQDRPEARALLTAVQQARSAAEEENFRERGREKALELMQQGQFAQAADLLHNLLSLFPGNPILERDLAAARSALGQLSSDTVPATGRKIPIPRRRLRDGRPYPGRIYGSPRDFAQALCPCPGAG